MPRSVLADNTGIDVPVKQNGVAVQTGTPAISLQDISRTFITKNGTARAVEDVSLDIGTGDIFGIIGYSGAGKSTVVRCINYLEKPDKGSVVIDGTDLASLSPAQLREKRKKIGMIFQQFNLFASRTVAGNIAYPLRHSTLNAEEKKQKVRDLLALVELEDKIHAYPSELSGGQKQRAAIARALANDPTVLLCDEATSALDPQTTQSILALLRDLNRRLGLTIVIITHEMGVIKAICNKAAVMDKGRVVEEGTVFDIFSTPKQDITKTFISTTTNLNKINELLETGSPIVSLEPGDILARFSYVGKTTVEPLISSISTRFGVTVNIILGDVEIVQDTPIGGLIVILSGEKASLEKAMEWIDEKKVHVEVIRHG